MLPTTPSVAASVRAELARRGVSGRKLARALGWTPAFTARRLAVRDPRPLRLDELTQIAAYLDVPLATLLVPTRDEVAP